MCLFGSTERGIKGAHGLHGGYYSEAAGLHGQDSTGAACVRALTRAISIVEKATFQAWKIQERMRGSKARGRARCGTNWYSLHDPAPAARLEVHVYAKQPSDGVRVAFSASTGRRLRGRPV